VQLFPPQIPHELDWNRNKKTLHISNKKLENEHSASSDNVPNNTLVIEEKHVDTTKFNVSFPSFHGKANMQNTTEKLTGLYCTGGIATYMTNFQQAYIVRGPRWRSWYSDASWA